MPIFVIVIIVERLGVLKRRRRRRRQERKAFGLAAKLFNEKRMHAFHIADMSATRRKHRDDKMKFLLRFVDGRHSHTHFTNVRRRR